MLQQWQFLQVHFFNLNKESEISETNLRFPSPISAWWIYGTRLQNMGSSLKKLTKMTYEKFSIVEKENKNLIKSIKKNMELVQIYF